MGCHFLLQGSSPFRDQTYGSCVAGGFFTTEPPGKPHGCLIECRILWIFLIVSLGQIMYSFLVHLPGELQQSPPCQKLLTTSSLCALPRSVLHVQSPAAHLHLYVHILPLGMEGVNVFNSTSPPLTQWLRIIGLLKCVRCLYMYFLTLFP